MSYAKKIMKHYLFLLPFLWLQACDNVSSITEHDDTANLYIPILDKTTVLSSTILRLNEMKGPCINRQFGLIQDNFRQGGNQIIATNKIYLYRV